ncbi:MAG TPA: single-stranded DNA-binding protein [Bacteroidales bacterium]|nr:single-stranded DNA-binding protein [Bacteroidales bacterium]HPT02349.1 single-stranded DNA-binding protein [Bacteroidales bacterium]
MNSLKNTVHLIGRLGQDPEVRTLDGGRKVARLSLATGETYASKDGNRRAAIQWHNLIVWGNLAGVCEKYLTKGREVAIAGKLTYRKWEDSQGLKHTNTEILVDELLLVGNSK